MEKETLKIFDDKKKDSKTFFCKNNYIIFWNGYEEDTDKNCFSVLNLIKKNPSLYRNQYLKWIFSLNTIKYKKQNLSDYFSLDDNFSFWNLSLFNEKCNFIKSPEINDAIKLIAIENFLKNKTIKKVILHSSNSYLVDCIRNWCVDNEVEFFSTNLPKFDSAINFIKNFFMILKSILWLFIYTYKRWSLKGFAIKYWLKKKSGFIFISYLTNFNHKKIIKGEFESFFWGNLPEKMLLNKYNSNWLHLWDPETYLKNPKDVISTLELLNSKNKCKQLHLTLDSFITFEIIFKTFISWCYNIFKSLKIQKTFFKNNNKGFNLGLLQKNDWYNSFYGIEGIKNLLFYNLLLSAFKYAPSKSNAFYLQENQGWEFGLIKAWRTNQTGLICAVPHFTMRFWDLRYFFHKDHYKTNNKDISLRPDKVLVNGKIQKNSLLNINYPKDELVIVEALRYNYLNKKKNANKKITKNAILICGDYDQKLNKDLFQILEKSIQVSNLKLKLYFKSHPASKAKFSPTNMEIKVLNENLNNVFPKVDLVLCSGNSSVALDALYFKLPVGIYLNQKNLNLSPLYNILDKIFFSNYLELSKILSKNLSNKHEVPKQINYFYLDNEVPLWLAFLKKIS